jgi:hypothetical protein
VGTFEFFVPEEDYREIVHDFDRTAPRWPGTTRLWTDGTGLEIERVRDSDIWSMSTKASGRLVDPGARLSRGVQRLLLAYGPSGATPRNYDWTVQPDDDYPCGGADLNTPDADGFGIGNDACARFIARHPLPGSTPAPQ